MGSTMKRFIAALVFSMFMVVAAAGGAQAYSSVLAFGDSLSDNGRNTTTDPFGAAQMSNGDVWVEYLAQDLGASLNDMAFAGATTGVDAPALYPVIGASALSNYGLQWQVGAYAQNYAPYYGGIADNTLVTISAGGNDMFNGRDAVTAANNIAGVLQYLIGLGGDAFMVMNLSPSQQSPAAQAWMAAFNTTLDANLAILKTYNPVVDLYLLDMRNFLADVDNYTGTWVANSCDNPNANPDTCTSETFAWYDTVGVHPTTEVHQQIAAYAATTVAPVPEPATIFLLLSGLAGLAGVRRKK